MLCLLLASMNSTQGLGPVAAIGIAVALVVMLTLLPALLVIFGRWFFWPLRPTYGSADHTETGVWARVGQRIARRPRTTWVVTALVLGVASLGILQLNANGLKNKDAFYGKPDSVVGEEVLARHFPAGSGQPVIVIADSRDKADAVTHRVRGRVRHRQRRATRSPRTGSTFLQGTLVRPGRQPGGEGHRRPGAGRGAPGAGRRRQGRRWHRDRAGHARAPRRPTTGVIIPVVLLVVFLILMLLLRAVVAPLVLIATVVLSFTAALGLSALVFRHVFGFAGADSSLPLFVFVFLVALGIDYNIFLMTRVHEEAKVLGTQARRARRASPPPAA